MAGILARANAAEVATTTSTKTIVQLVAPTNQRLKVWQWGVGFKGITNSDAPIKVDLVEQSTAGTSSALSTVREPDGGSETLQGTAREAVTVEPTLTSVLESHEIHPQGGSFDWVAPQINPILMAGGKRLGIRVTAGVSVSCTAYFRYEE